MQRTALVLVLAAVAVSRATLDAPGLACAGPLIDPTLDAGSPFGPAAFGLGAVEPRAASLDLTGPRVGAARHVDVEVMQLMPDARGVLGAGLSPDDVSIQAISLTWRSAFEGPLSPHVGLGPRSSSRAWRSVTRVSREGRGRA